MTRIKARFIVLAVVLASLLAQVGAVAQAPESPTVSVCLPGAGYTSGCDVDQDGDIDILDIQLTAGRWNSSGAYTTGHTHWEETWTGSTGNHGLRLEHTAATSLTYGLWAQSASSDGVGVKGVASGSGSSVGVSGQTAGSIGTGVSGWASSSAGLNYGVWGESASSSGTGVLGMATSLNGASAGVQGKSNSTTGYGGRFEGYGLDALLAVNLASGRAMQAYAPSDTAIWARTDNGLAALDGWNGSPTGRGLSGWASSTTGFNHGVWGQSASSSGTGVLGTAISASGDTTGVYGESVSADGQGVYGKATSASGFTYGVYGQSASTDGRGVYGIATATSGVAIGVYGVTGSASGYAGYFVGNTQVVGTLNKSGGSFKIDHPLDPANRYLSHSFVESPDMMNIYNGNVILDESGEAWVDLPGWFEALNRDFRYQLTTVGGWAPVYVAQKISGNRFQIAGGQLGLEVSWQVTGIRQDAWANAHRIPVEEEKPAGERGLYLHPVELGQPAALGLDYQRSTGRDQVSAMAPSDTPPSTTSTLPVVKLDAAEAR